MITYQPSTGGGGGFAFAPHDWASQSGGFGIGADDFVAPVDLSTLDAGSSVSSSSRSGENKILNFSPTVGDLATTLVGLHLFDVANLEEGCWAVRLIAKHTATGEAVGTPAGSLRSQFGVALFGNADLSGAWIGGLLYGSGATPASYAVVSSGSANRTGSANSSTMGVGSYMLGQPIDFFIKRTGSRVEVAYGLDGSVQRFATIAGSSGIGVIGVIASVETASILTISTVRAIKLDNFPL